MLRRKSPSSEPSTSPASILAAGSRSVGRWESDDDVILAGSFEGRIRSGRSVQLLAGSSVQGDVDATEIVVQGEVTGNLLARERIRILEGGNVNGDVCAPQVTVQEGVEINARIRMLTADHETREYLLPVLLRAEAGAAPREWQELLNSSEEFLDHMGFLVETRARPGILMRSIFRTRQPLTYDDFYARMAAMDATLLHASGGAESTRNTPPSPEASELARKLLEALGDAEGAVGIVGSTVVRIQEGRGGGMQRDVRQRPEILPTPDVSEVPRPGDLLLELQRIQVDVLGESTFMDRV